MMSCPKALLIGAHLCFLMSGLLPAQTLPTGFTLDVLATGLVTPIGLDQLPDGRLLVVEQNTGAVKVVAGGSIGTLGQVTGLTVSYSRGLIGIAVDPQWPTRPFVYLFHAHALPPSMRISRHSVTGDLSVATSTSLSLGPPYLVLDAIPDQDPIHNAGSLRFGPDGMLYASFGEDAAPCDAQDPQALRGKILRLDVSGLPLAGAGPPPLSALIPPGNPFSGPTDSARLVWSLGLRNPFSFHADAMTGRLMIADVGADAWDEIHEETVGGTNFGWPHWEGSMPFQSCPTAPPGFVAPVATLAHGAGPASLISLGVYRNRPGGAHNFGGDYEGDYLYVDHFDGLVRRIRRSGSTWSPAPPAPGQPGSSWASGLPRVSDALVGSDGALYYLHRPGSSGGGSLRRIRPSSRQVSVVAGNGQLVTAGRTATTPLEIVVTSATGDPVPQLPVTFSLMQGGGALGPQPVLTDALGRAATSFTADASDPTDPVVSVLVPGANPLTFNLTWRGLLANHDAATGTLSATVVHTELQSPVTLAIDLPTPVPQATPWGPVWTSILAPGNNAVAFDGLGLVGPPQAGIATGNLVPSWSLSLPGLPPLGGVNIVLQAYAIDAGLLPAPTAVLISNPVGLTLP